MNITEAEQICEEFVASFQILELFHGTVGFGRPCIGLRDTTTGCMVDLYNHNYEEPETDFFDAPPETPSAYHKHDCFCVLVEGTKEEATIELAHWVNKLAKLDIKKLTQYRQESSFTGLSSYFELN